MDMPIQIDVAALDSSQRQTFEGVLGRPLSGDERLVVQVESASNDADVKSPASLLGLLTHFYDGLCDDEIEELDRAIKLRADFSRPSP